MALYIFITTMLAATAKCLLHKLESTYAKFSGKEPWLTFEKVIFKRYSSKFLVFDEQPQMSGICTAKNKNV